MEMDVVTGGWNLSFDEVVETLKEPIRYEFIGGEKEFEAHVLEHLPDIFEGLGLPPIRFIKRQHQINIDNFMVRMDLVAKHEDESITVIEVKCRNKKQPHVAPFNQMTAVGQLLLYKSVIKAKYKTDPRLILIDNKIHYRTMVAFSEMILPITLIELQNDRVFVPYNALQKGGIYSEFDRETTAIC